MKTKYSTIFILLCGLAACEFVSMIHVYLSNQEILCNMKKLSEISYLIVPNKHIFPLLDSIKTCIYGGLFFTLTLGIGISLLSLFLLLTLNKINTKDNYEFTLLKKIKILNSNNFTVSKKKCYIVFLIIFWVSLILITNINGFNFSSFYLLFIPLSIIISFKIFNKNKNKIIFFDRINIIPIGFIFFVILIIIPDISFINIRDYILLSNKHLEKISDFYYKYTLFPSEAFKPMELKLINTYSINDDYSKSQNYDTIKKRLIKRLERLDYFLIQDIKNNLNITIDDNNIIFHFHDKIILKTDYKEFFKDSQKILKKVSNITDRHFFLRYLTFLSLIFGLPLFTYLIIYIFLFFCSELIFLKLLKIKFSIKYQFIVISSLMVILSLLIISIFPDNDEKNITKDKINSDLKSKNLIKRVNALKNILKNKYDISNFIEYENLLNTDNTAEKYWLVRSFGISSNYKTYEKIFNFINDKSIIVRCQSLHALSKRGLRSSINKIIPIIQESKEWYVQLYAYKALKRLGWNQSLTYKKNFINKK